MAIFYTSKRLDTSKILSSMHSGGLAGWLFFDSIQWVGLRWLNIIVADSGSSAYRIASNISRVGDKWRLLLAGC